MGSLAGLALALVACGDLLGLDDFGNHETSTSTSGESPSTVSNTSSASGSESSVGGAGGSVSVGSTAESSTAASSGGAGGDIGPKLRVFVTSTLYEPNVVDSVVNANQLCQLAADTASLGGTWHAWLSDFVTSAIDNITADGPWVTIDGQPVFDGKADMVDIDPLQNGIVLDEAMVDHSTSVVWTGTAMGGQAFAYCFNGSNNGNSWDVSGTDATFGLAGQLNFAWTDYGLLACQSFGRLYCFEQ